MSQNQSVEVAAIEAAEVLLSAIRDSDLPARIADDTFCVLLSGDAKGSEVAVLSRLVEAIAVHDANKPEPAGEVVDPDTGARIPIIPVPENTVTTPVVQPVPEGAQR